MCKFIAVLSCVICFLQAPGQRRLQAGEKVPDLKFENILYYAAPQAQLDDFKGKIIILDFWATWCSACIKKFPLLDSLQEQFTDKLQVILLNSVTTGDDPFTIARALEKYSAHPGKAWRIPTTVYDSVTQNLFPHHLLPHYIWIDADGNYLAATGAKDVTAANVQALLDGKVPAFHVKDDMDTERPLFSSPSLDGAFPEHYAVITKGHYPGLSSGMNFRQSNGKVHGYAFKNLPLERVYTWVIERLEGESRKNGGSAASNGKKATMPKPAIQLKLEDTTDFCGPADYNMDWYEAHARTIDFILPVEEAEVFYSRLLAFLNLYSGYVARKEGDTWVVLRADGL